MSMEVVEARSKLYRLDCVRKVVNALLKCKWLRSATPCVWVRFPQSFTAFSDSSLARFHVAKFVSLLTNSHTGFTQEETAVVLKSIPTNLRTSGRLLQSIVTTFTNIQKTLEVKDPHGPMMALLDYEWATPLASVTVTLNDGTSNVPLGDALAACYFPTQVHLDIFEKLRDLGYQFSNNIVKSFDAAQRTAKKHKVVNEQNYRVQGLLKQLLKLQQTMRPKSTKSHRHRPLPLPLYAG